MSWEPGQLVRHLDNPAKTGTVTNQTRPKSNGLQYRVNWNGRLDWHYAGELVATGNVGEDYFELIRQGRFGRVEDLRRLLTHIHLAGRLANVVYAMGLTQTDFFPHQYKPLLTLLESPVNGLLIADEVGLGKTIEAGLIWTELRARHDMRRLLVVCPAMLREKWRAELSSRFGVEAELVDAAGLLKGLERDEHKERAWIVSYQGVRIPSEWNQDELDTSTKNPREKLANFLFQNADGDPLIDLVIFDEAHYMRNEETSTWRTGSLLRDISMHQLMLSATPINLHSDDLFNILRLLDPDHFESKFEFENTLQANVPVVKASDIVRNPANDSKRIQEALQELKISRWFKNSERVERLINECLSVDNWTNEKRIEIAAKLERLNLLAHIVSRTRKREVHTERVFRDATVTEVEMSDLEKKIYAAITEGTREYAIANDIKHGFLLSTPQRMVSSCAVSLIRSWKVGGEDLDGEVVLSDEIHEDQEKIAATNSSLKNWLSKRVLSSFNVEELTRSDTKYAELLKNLRRLISDDSTTKAIIFTTFRGTASYLHERLIRDELSSLLLMGGNDFDKDSVVTEFRNGKEYKILICTDVAAEGVDLQFCRLVVNYDLPWNPMRIEQRIGRIDRIGQKSSRILIWNFVHKDTIDAHILSRLTSRIGVFEETLGGTEEILGQIRLLENSLLSSHLTKAEQEKMIEQVALAIENTRKQQESLEHEAIQLVAHGQQLMAQIESSKGEGRVISVNDLIGYVQGFIKRSPGSRFISAPSEENLFEINLSPQVAAEMDVFLERENIGNKTRLHKGQSIRCRFTEKITTKSSFNEEAIHRFHPLIKFISHKEDANNEAFPLYSSKISSSSVGSGQYVIVVRMVTFSGIKDEEHLIVASERLEDAFQLDNKTAESLLDNVRSQGNEWVTSNLDTNKEKSLAAVERCEERLGERYRLMREEKLNQNSDRAGLLIQLVDEHISKKKISYETRIANHEYIASFNPESTDSKRRKGLARAELKKMNDFLSRMETKRVLFQTKSNAFSSNVEDICVLLVDNA